MSTHPDPEPPFPDPFDEEEVVREILKRLSDGDPAARNQLFEANLAQLKELARRLMSAQPAGHTLQATALVSEAYVKLFGREPKTFRDRAHFLRVAAVAMRHLLVDHARAKAARKRTKLDGLFEDDEGTASDEEARAFLEFNEELERLGAAHPEMAKAIQMKLFLGMSMKEIAEALGMPLRTFEREYASAVALLAARLGR